MEHRNRYTVAFRKGKVYERPGKETMTCKETDTLLPDISNGISKRKREKQIEQLLLHLHQPPSVRLPGEWKFIIRPRLFGRVDLIIGRRQCRGNNLVQHRPNHLSITGTVDLGSRVNHFDEGQRPLMQIPHHLAGMLETACAVHVLDGITLDLLILGLLFQNGQQLVVGRVGANAVNDGKGEFALGQILAHTLILGVGGVCQVQVIIADLENQSHDIHQSHTVFAGRALRLHELDRQSEKTTGLVPDHLQVLVLGGAGKRVAPEKIHPLAAVQIQKLFHVDVDGSRTAQLLHLLQGQEVDIVGRVDRLRSAEDVVRHGDTATQNRRVLDVVNPEEKGHGQRERQGGTRLRDVSQKRS